LVPRRFGAELLGSFVAAVDLVAFGAGSGALGSASEVDISSVMSRVRWRHTDHRLVIAREEHFAAIVKQEIEYGERKRFQIRVSTLSSTSDWSPGGDRESSVAGTFNSRPFTPVRI
jgi:hypothetical protein